jgi:hypothetical protein
MTWRDIADRSYESNRRRDKRVEVSEKIMEYVSIFFTSPYKFIHLFNPLNLSSLAAGIMEKGWYLGGEPILTRAEAKHYDGTNVVVHRNDKSFTDLGIVIR